jgi:TPR repeat protein
MLNLGHNYKLEKNILKSIYYLYLSSLNGNVYAMRYLGYQYGSINQIYEKIYWFVRAATNNNDKVCSYIEKYYDKIISDEKLLYHLMNCKLTIETEIIIEKIYDFLSDDLQIVLDYIEMKQKCCVIDADENMECMTAEKIFRMAIKYEKQNDIINKIKWYKIAVEYGHKISSKYLEFLESDIVTVIELIKCFRNYNASEEYLYYLEIGSKLGNIDIMYELGNYYKKYNGDEKMIAIYEKAATYGHRDAMVSLGLYYSENIEKQKYWYFKAADHKSPKACLHLYIYYKTNNDLNNMIKWGELVYKYGNNEISYDLGNNYKTKKDVPNMLKWYKISASHNNSHAMFELGEFYMSKNIKKDGIEWYTKSYKIGLKKSFIKMVEFYTEQNSEVRKVFLDEYCDVMINVYGVFSSETRHMRR